MTSDKAVKKLLLYIESMDLSVDEFIEWMKKQKVKKMRKCPKCFSRNYDLRMENQVTMTFKDGKLTHHWSNVVTSRIADCLICGHSWDIDVQDERVKE